MFNVFDTKLKFEFFTNHWKLSDCVAPLILYVEKYLKIQQIISQNRKLLSFFLIVCDKDYFIARNLLSQQVLLN